jgi:hypothetical protein
MGGDGICHERLKSQATGGLVEETLRKRLAGKVYARVAVTALLVSVTFRPVFVIFLKSTVSS